MSIKTQKTNNINYKLFLSEKNFILSLINKTRIIYYSKLIAKKIYTSNSACNRQFGQINYVHRRTLHVATDKKKKLKEKKSTPKKVSVQPVVEPIGVENLLEISQKNITENRSMLLLTNGPLLVKEPTFYKNFPVLDTLSLFTIGKLKHVPALNGKQKKALLKIRKILTKTNKTNTPQMYKLFLPDEDLVPDYGSYVITLQGGVMRNYNTSEVERESAKSIHSITINPTTFLIKLGESNPKSDIGIYRTMFDPGCSYIIEYRKILKIKKLKFSEEQYTFQELKLHKEFEEFIYRRRKLEERKKMSSVNRKKIKNLTTC